MTRRSKQFGRKFKPWYDHNHPRHPANIEKKKRLLAAIDKLRKSGPTIGELAEKKP
jgi:hypothetical protein